MPPLRGPIDYNRYPPRRRVVASPTSRDDDENTRDNATSESAARDVADHQDTDENKHVYRARAATSAEASTREASMRRALEGREHASGASQSAPQTPRAGRKNRGRTRRREKLLRHEANLRGQDGARVVSRRTMRAAARRKVLFRRARFVLFLLCLGLLGQGVYAAFTSPRFAIAAVDLDGAQITPRENLEAVQRDLLGRNWLRAPLGKAREELINLPTVRAAHLTRQMTWPPRVLVTIEERQPFARVGGGENWFVVDRSGVPFRRATPEDDALFAITSPLFRPHAGVAFSARNWKAARELTNLLGAEKADDAGASWNLRRVYFDRHGFASIRLRGGVQDGLLIQLGNDSWAEKLPRARRALNYFAASGRRASSLNLVSYAMPIWTPHAPEKTAAEAVQAAANGVS